MQLTSIDIERISKRGYKFKDFVVKNRGELNLKNHNNKCVFLRDNGCTIYWYRPEGCRLYPLIYNYNSQIGEIDDFCPYNHEFQVTSEDVNRLFILLKKFTSE
jgi:Fe-S-cluster containining protein